MMLTEKTPPLLLPLSLVVACLTAGCAPKARPTETAVPTTAEASADESPSSHSATGAAKQPEDEKRAAAAAGEFEGTQSASEEDRDFEEDDSSDKAGEAAPMAPDLSEPQREKRKVSLLGELKLQVQDFNESLQPETQSCGGARPLKDAICSLAGRICEMEEPSTIKSEDCSRARESCEKAKKHYQSKCG